MIGVGYRAQLQGTKLVLSVGKSHQDEVKHQKTSNLLLQLQLLSLLKVSAKKLLVKQQLTSVAVVLQNLIKVKGSVTLVNTFVVKKVKLVNNFCQNNVHLNIYLAKNVIRNWWFDLSNCQYFVNANFVRQTKTPRLLTAF